MSKQTPPSEHHFYVAIAKFLFQHPEYGIVSVQDSIRLKDAEQYKLNPLILYGLTVAGLPTRWMTFTPVDQPRAFRDVLQEAWQKSGDLCGRPDTLRINRHLATASPELIQNLAKIGVQVEVANAKEKALSASLRVAQDASKWLYLPVQEPVSTLVGKLDWEPGSWLTTWESALPPNPPRYFKLDEFGGRTWLLTGKKCPEDIANNDDSWGDNTYDNMSEIAKSLIACWPNPPVEIAKGAGITLRELQWFITRKIRLELPARVALEDLLGIEYDERSGDCVAAGPYVLMAHNPKALADVYGAISQGWNAQPWEIIPRNGVADPSWRYILINTYGKPPSIVMSPRGAKITERLPELLSNYSGITPVSPEFYRDVVSTCARACREPATHVREIKTFVKRYKEKWANCCWQPE